MSYRCRHWKIQELVSKKVYKARGEKAWDLLDPRGLEMLDLIVDDFGPCYCNNWESGGNFTLRGLRSIIDKPDCDREGIWLNFGQHEAGRAWDINPIKKTVKEVREAILANPQRYKYIKGVEIADGWLHIDVRNSLEVQVFKA